MKALVLVNGQLYKPNILRKRISSTEFDLVLGADRGILHARILNVIPDALIGDQDSITGPEREEFSNIECISYPAEKDETDLELAMLYARDQGASKIVLVGAMGGRMDMIIANFLLMNHPGLRSCRVEIWHGDQTGCLIRPPGEDIQGHPGDTLSLIPLGCDASGVMTTGMKYPLRQERLISGSGRGLSNLIETTTARVVLTEGLLLAVHTPGRA